MYSSTAKNRNFQKRVGSQSTRIMANGNAPMEPDRHLVDATCKEQLAIMRANRSALSRTIGLLEGAERNRATSILADLNREIGHLAKMIEDNSRARFEEIFVTVANRRLPKDAFLELVQEARRYWRQEGSIVNLPSGTQQAQNKKAKRAYKESSALHEEET